MAVRKSAAKRRKHRSAAAKAAIAHPAKLSAPRVGKIFERLRLYRLLDQAKASPVLWLSAPAGAGKTTLIASYAQRRKLRCCWYQVDAGDRDLAGFFYNLASVLRPSNTRTRRPLPQLTPEYQSTLTTFARNYFHAAFERMPPPFMLVFDNFQEVQHDEAFMQTLLAGIEMLPPSCRAIFVSRHEPPPSVARLQLNRQLVHLGWNDVRLDASESGEFMRFYDPSRTDTSAESLYRQSNGWLAGLILLLEGARGQDRPVLDGNSANTLFGYFISEVFSRRSDTVRNFLLQTSLFPYFTADMAEKLTGVPQPQVLLDDLVLQHHFTEKRTDTPPTYQYHPLFLEFLRHQSAVTWGTEQASETRRRAAWILGQTTEPEHALPLYLAAGELQSAARLILTLAPQFMATHRFGTLAAAIASLPAAVVDAEPWLLYWRGLCALADPAQARADLERSYAKFDERDDPAGLYLSWSAIINSYNIEWSDFRPTDRWIEAFDSLQQRHPDFPSRTVEAQAVFAILTVLLNRRLDGASTAKWAQRAEMLMREGADLSQRGTFGVSLVLYYCSMGDTLRAREVSRYLLATLHLRPDPSVASVLQVGISYDACMNGDYGSALSRVNETLETMERTGAIAWAIQSLGEHMYVHLIRGDPDSAEPYLDRMRGLLPTAGRIHTTFYLNLASAVAFHRGDLDAAADLARSATASVRDTGPSYGETDCFMVEGHVAVSRGDLPTAERALADLQHKADLSGSRWCAYCALLLKARMALETGSGDGIGILRQALALSRAMRGRNLPWISHEVLRSLFATALDHDIETEHVRELIERFGLTPGNDAIALDAWPFPIKIYTLGRFGLMRDGRPVPRGQAVKPLELLKALIALGGRDVSQEQLTDILWADAEGDAGRRAFDTTLHRLRKLLGRDDALPLVNGRLTLDSRHCWVDVWALEREVNLLDDACRRDSLPDGIGARLERLWKLYRGPFLENERTLAFALAPRERLQLRVVALIRELGRRFEAQEQVDAARQCYENALAIDPLIEDFYRRLIGLHVRAGHQAEALRIYKRCRKILREVLDVAPSAETEAAVIGIVPTASRAR